MPYGGTTPEQDKKIERCVAKKVKGGMEKTKAIKICKSSVLGKEKTPKLIENVRISFNAPLTSEAIGKDNNSRKIAGMAVPAQESRNGRAYKLEDLNKAKFNGKPYAEGIMLNMGLNHSEDVTDIVGKWKPIFNDAGIAFEGMVYNTGKYPYITDMLDKKLWESVSVEMMADLIEEDGGVFAKNQDILGLDFVKHPGLPDANVGIAEAFEKAVKESSIQIDEPEAEHPEGDENMEKEEIMVKEEEEKQEEEEPKEEVPEEKSEEPEPEAPSTDNKETETLIKKTLEKVEELSKDVKKLKETPKSKGKVTEKSEPEISLVKERAGGKMNIYSEEILY